MLIWAHMCYSLCSSVDNILIVSSVWSLVLRQSPSCFCCCIVYLRILASKLLSDSPVSTSHLAIKVLGLQICATTSGLYVGSEEQRQDTRCLCKGFFFLSHLTDPDFIKRRWKPGMVIHTCSPNLQEASEGGWPQMRGLHSETINKPKISDWRN